ncbi:tyrosinase family oxidase copper chaperone [Streptomyces sp. NPDC089424]|uniref:tyrosinase family oxidase copper chaperone n=1 Tax=Streptomyces sp. NPDC089424 TaxID=3365917 RepID=UPI00382079F3
MVVGGGVAEGAGGGGAVRPGAAGGGAGPRRHVAAGAEGTVARGTRRDVVRGLLASAAVLAVPACDPGELLGDTFDETYRGRRIRGSGGQVTVDGRPLHLMRRADGTWLSMIDHYCSYPTPREAARAAVDELGTTGALPLTEGAHHGVHA